MLNKLLDWLIAERCVVACNLAPALQGIYEIFGAMSVGPNCSTIDDRFNLSHELLLQWQRALEIVCCLQEAIASGGCFDTQESSKTGQHQP
jgi:hypothetical protein